MKKLLIGLLLLVLFAGTSQAVLTKSVAAVDEWAAIAQNAVREGATTDISGNYTSVLYIDIALTSSTAHTGTKIEVQVSSYTAASPSDEGWTTLTSLIGPDGTANPEALSGAEAAGQTVLEVASTTGLYGDDEVRWIYCKDDTIADSEMMLLVSHVGNTSVTVQDGTTNAHTAADTLYDIAKNYVITIPIEYNRVRVIYDNTVDSNGSTVDTKCRISQVTGL